MIEWLVSPEGLLVLLGTVSLVVIYFMLADDDTLQERIDSVQRDIMVREQKRKGGDDAEEEDDNVVSKVMTRMRGLAQTTEKNIQAVEVFGEKEVSKMTADLRAAGYYEKEAITIVMLWKFILALTFGGLMTLWRFTGVEEKTYFDYSLVALAVLFGFQSVDYVLKVLANKRRLRIRRTLPDVVDILLICVNSGMTFEAALQRICIEMSGFKQDIIVELEKTLLEMQYLNDRTDALRNFAERLSIEEVKAFSATIIQSEKHGTAIADGLNTFTHEMRKNRLNDIEKWSAKVPTLLTLPMAIFLLPIFFLVTLGPGVLTAMKSF
ncbi:MAG: type II secretion system F family protein [Alphaproteobacteria bacterium GM202ARS2]|nr:type II secretion system F family protein [Alphaproteobacteria bacterium GM202ARS2]